jgi:hypothetical protein
MTDLLVNRNAAYRHGHIAAGGIVTPEISPVVAKNDVYAHLHQLWQLRPRDLMAVEQGYVGPGCA